MYKNHRYFFEAMYNVSMVIGLTKLKVMMNNRGLE